MAQQSDNNATDDQPAATEFLLALDGEKIKTIKAHAPISLTFVAANVVGFDFMFITFVTLLIESRQLATASLTTADFFIAVAITFLAQSLMHAGKLYRIELIANYAMFCRRFAAGMILPGLAAAAYYGLRVVVLKNPGNSGITLLQLGLAVFCMLGYRFIWSRAFRYFEHHGIVRYNVAVIGVAELASQFEAQVRQQGLGVRVAAVFPHDVTQAEDHGRAPGTPPAGVSALLRYSRSNSVDAVVIALPGLPATELRPLVRQLEAEPLRIRLLPAPGPAAFPRNFVAAAGEAPGVKLTAVSDPPIWGLARDTKRAFDLLAASFALVFFGPLMIICALGVKFSSPGPILFRQQRIGFRNVEFSVYKFRTMHQAACNMGTLTIRDDPRTFGFGQLLRKLSLDELPQLFNVLQGDMSMVGPRPHMSEARAAGIIYHQAIAQYEARHRVKPGITGLAQVSGWRGPTDTIEQIEKRVEHDLKYIQSWSLLLDLKILAKTAFGGFFGKNAF